MALRDVVRRKRLNPGTTFNESSSGVGGVSARSADDSTDTGAAALVVRTLEPAPAGKDYEIWVLEDGVPQRAGLFERPGVAVLTRPVASGQTVAVTLEPDGGRDAPSGEPLFTAARA